MTIQTASMAALRGDDFSLVRRHGALLRRCPWNRPERVSRCARRADCAQRYARAKEEFAASMRGEAKGKEGDQDGI